MSVYALLSRLEGVRKTGADRWLARCPSHGDKHASLSIRELDDGRTLLHCFASCGVDEVLSAVGLEMDALFPKRPATVHGYKPERRPFNAYDVLRALAFEVTTVRMIAISMQRNGRLSDASQERLTLSMVRLLNADEMINAG